ncbi:hypothetical protein INS49_007610 [Diaporthe citri]|uniref:uncharacterized protein n=1 Tax=Diaporthe citri TaxID=83186 RepID=UPI001C7F863A|nr:uncharacterized protein INS49_007610 [Diaporthe citri]KAG6362518.1 hypothetical protein INS49_007610 [Diaporthe citri]
MPYDLPHKSRSNQSMSMGYQKGKNRSRLPAEPPVTRPVPFHPVQSSDTETQPPKQQPRCYSAESRRNPSRYSAMVFSSYQLFYIYASLNNLQPRACYSREQHLLTDELIITAERACIGPFVTSMDPDSQEYMRIFTALCTPGLLTGKTPTLILTNLCRINAWTEPEHRVDGVDGALGIAMSKIESMRDAEEPEDDEYAEIITHFITLWAKWLQKIFAEVLAENKKLTPIIAMCKTG